MSPRTRAAAVVAQLGAEYRRAADTLRSALRAYMQGGKLPDPALRAERAFTYPELRLAYAGVHTQPRIARSYARFNGPGVYGVTITRPDLFADYLSEQLTLIMSDFEVEVA